MSWLVSAKQYIPAVIGEPFGGGFFAGYISHTANSSPTHALIVAPRATGATGTGYPVTTLLQWKTSLTTTTGAGSSFDGVANTAAMVAAGIDNHPAAKFCVNLAIGGYTDWYLPSRFEIDVAHFNLKPTNGQNPAENNIYAVPRRDSNYTASGPPFQTYVAAFAGGSEAFTTGNHWTSTQTASNSARYFTFTNFIGSDLITNAHGVRAFRRITL